MIVLCFFWRNIPDDSWISEMSMWPILFIWYIRSLICGINCIYFKKYTGNNILIRSNTLTWISAMIKELKYDISDMLKQRDESELSGSSNSQVEWAQVKSDIADMMKRRDEERASSTDSSGSSMDLLREYVQLRADVSEMIKQMDELRKTPSSTDTVALITKQNDNDEESSSSTGRKS